MIRKWFRKPVAPAPTKNQATFTDKLITLQSNPPEKWSVDEVTVYLDLIDLGDYKAEFKANSISGRDMLELSNEDLVRLGMARIGHRKQYLRKIKALTKQDDGAFRDGAANDNSGTSSHSESSSTDSRKMSGKSQSASSLEASSETKETTIKIKCVYEDRTKLFSMTRITFDRLRKEVGKRWELKGFLIKYIDSDGDAIDIGGDDDLEEVLKEAGTSLKISVEPKHKHNYITNAEKELLDGLLEPVFVFSKNGKFVLRNTAAANLPGANAFQILPELDVESYLSTGKSSQIGRRTTMEVRMGSGASKMEVSVAETRTKSRHTFTATLHQQRATDWGSTYDRVADGVVIIDPHGSVKYANPAVSTLFGYSSSELVGANVKKLMPEEDAAKHDGYLRNYRRSGVAKVIGTGRSVVGQAKDGGLVPIHLTLIEQRLQGDERLFIGLMRLLDLESAPLRTLLQSERETVEALAAPAVIIDEGGIIQGLNTKTEQLFGYKYVELIGRNVTMLMPPDVGQHHNNYLANYIKTGKSHIIGIGRDVIAIAKGGRNLTVSLYVTEKTDGDSILFTGIFSQKERKKK